MKVITAKQELNLVNQLVIDYKKQVHQNVKARFVSHLPFGDAVTQSKGDKHTIYFGTAPFLKSDDLLLTEQQITTSRVAAFHELAHCDQYHSKNTPRDIIISRLSVYQNNKYYRNNWKFQLFEIDAEYTGIMNAHKHLTKEYPNRADQMILNYLNNRIQTHKYMIPDSVGKVTSISEIGSLFDDACQKSLINNRTFPHGWERSNDQIAQMFRLPNKTLCPEYTPFYNDLIYTHDGKEFDHKMATLVLCIHPEKKLEYPHIDFTDFTPDHDFGRTLPESYDSLKSRIKPQSANDLFYSETGISISEFTNAVETITNYENSIAIKPFT